MAAKEPQQGVGGAGNKTAQNFVAQLREEGQSEQEIRQTLKGYGYKAGRASQLIKATRPTEEQVGARTASGATRALRRPAAASGPLRRPAAASGPRAFPTESEVETEDEAGVAMVFHVRNSSNTCCTSVI